MVIQFLRPIWIFNQVQLTILHRLQTHILPKGKRRVVPLKSWVLQQRFQSPAPRHLVRGQITEVQKGRIDVDEANHPVTLDTGRHPRRFDDQWRHVRAVPEGVFLEDVLFTKVIAMIAPEHHDRIVRVGAVVQGIQDAPDLAIDIGNIG